MLSIRQSRGSMFIFPVRVLDISRDKPRAYDWCDQLLAVDSHRYPVGVLKALPAGEHLLSQFRSCRLESSWILETT